MKRYPAFPLPVLLVLVLVYFSRLPRVSSLHTMFCIRFPPASFPNEVYEPSGDGDVQSVGMEKFPPDIWHKYYFSTSPEKFPNGTISPVTTITSALGAALEFKIQVFNIQGRASGSNEPLNGWFRIKVTFSLTGPLDRYVQSFILYAVDEQQNNVGEFVYDFPTTAGGDCPRTDASKYMIISCGGVSKYEPMASNVIVFARNQTPSWPEQYKDYWPIVSPLNDQDINFYFRHSIQDSNKGRHKVVLFRFIGDLDENADYSKDGVAAQYTQRIATTLLSATAWFQLKPQSVPGAADPLPTNPTSIQCSEPLFEAIQSGTGNTERRLSWQWYIQSFSGGAGFDTQQFQSAKTFANTVYQNTGCTGKYFGGRCSDTLCSVLTSQDPDKKRNRPHFGSIPHWHHTKFSKCGCQGSLWECVSDTHQNPETFNNATTKFHDCLEHLVEIYKKSPCNLTEEEATKVKTTVIRKRRIPHVGEGAGKGDDEMENEAPPPAPGGGAADSGGGGNETSAGGVPDVDARGVRTYGFGTVLYGCRKGHGVVMSMAAMFFFPVSIFVSRYYKETFMSFRILYAKVWLQLHIQCVFWIFALYLGGILLGLVGRALLGVSLVTAGLIHRLVGWLCVGLFLVLSSIGGIRCIDDPQRKWSIMTHWILGYILYGLNLAAIISSAYIPGCPAADHDESVLRDEDEPAFNKVVITVIVWLLFETIVGVIMTLFIHTQDRFMAVTGPRIYIPCCCGAPIPVLRENTLKDASGAGLRFIMFWLYIGSAILFAAAICGVIISHKPLFFFGFGPMACTHTWSKKLQRYVMREKIAEECRYS